MSEVINAAFAHLEQILRERSAELREAREALQAISGLGDVPGALLDSDEANSPDDARDQAYQAGLYAAGEIARRVLLTHSARGA